MSNAASLSFGVVFSFCFKPVISLAPPARLDLVSAQPLPLLDQLPLFAAAVSPSGVRAFHRSAVAEKADGAGSRPDRVPLSRAAAAGRHTRSQFLGRQDFSSRPSLEQMGQKH